MTTPGPTTAPRTPLLVVETNAHQVAGHHHAVLISLAHAAATADRPVVIAAPRGITADTRAQLRAVGARIVTGGRGGRGLLAAGRALAALSAAGQWLTRSRRWPQAVRRAPHQLTLVSRCLSEAAALRAGARAARTPIPVAVVLSASEALHTLTAAAARIAHQRFVHEVVTTEDGPVRLLGRLGHRHRQHVTILCPTPAVADDVTRRFPHLDVRTTPFALADPRTYLTDAERATARTHLAVAADSRVIALVGGWWPHKDIDTVIRGLAGTTRPLHLIAAGAPMRIAALDPIRQRPHLGLTVIHQPLSLAEIRQVYAAADAVIVARPAGTGKESGLLADAANHGVAAIVSDHDPTLTARLQQMPWVSIFRAGDPTDLARLLNRRTFPTRPPPGAAATLGLLTPSQAIDRFTATAPVHRRNSP